MMRRLPPLAPLLAFEAVARHGSFTLAGVELGLTQSAVSHRIRQLEEHVGAKLFERLNPGLRLTTRGRALLPGLTQALDMLARLDRPRSDGKAARPIRIGAGAALVHWWLARRLVLFSEDHPDIPLEIVPFEALDDAQRTEVDLRILWGAAGATPIDSSECTLCQEHVFPVCHPSLLTEADPLGEADLRTYPLIYKGPADEHDLVDMSMEWQWRYWIGDPVPSPRLRVREIGAALAAASEGLGVALGRSLLVHDAMASGRLTRVRSVRRHAPSTKRHVVRWSRMLDRDTRIEAIVEWLGREAELTVRRTMEKPPVPEDSVAAAAAAGW